MTKTMKYYKPNSIVSYYVIDNDSVQMTRFLKVLRCQLI